MTLNGIIALILGFFPPNSIALQADDVTVVEDVRKISFPSPILPLLTKTNASCSTVSAIAELPVLTRISPF